MAIEKKWIPDKNGAGHYLLYSTLIPKLEVHSNGYSDADIKEDIHELELEEQRCLNA